MVCVFLVKKTDVCFLDIFIVIRGEYINIADRPQVETMSVVQTLRTLLTAFVHVLIRITVSSLCIHVKTLPALVHSYENTEADM